MSAADVGLYPGPDGPTGGWSGSATSRERAYREEISGVRGHRSRTVLALVIAAKAHGVTDPEVQDVLGVGHGASSGALTRLHRAGLIVRLTERRSRNEVYVHPDYVGERETVPYRPNTGAPQRGLRAAAAIAEQRLARTEEALRRQGPAAQPTVRSYLEGKSTAYRQIASELYALADAEQEARANRVR